MEREEIADILESLSDEEFKTLMTHVLVKARRETERAKLNSLLPSKVLEENR